MTDRHASPFQRPAQIRNRIIHRFQPVLRMCLNAHRQIRRTHRQTIHTCLREQMPARSGLYRLNLQPQNPKAIPPIRVLLCLFTFRASPMSPAKTAPSIWRIIKIVQRIINRLFQLGLRNLDPTRTQIEIIANQIGIARVFNPKLHEHIALGSHIAKRRDALFAQRRMLAVNRHKIVIIFIHNLIKSIRRRIRCHRHTKNAFTIAVFLF